MKYLFLDDERKPEDVTWALLSGIGYQAVDWEIVRSYDEAVAWVTENGFPGIISFDHDLGLMHYAMDYSDGKTGYDFAKWLIDYDMDTGSMPDNFSYTVHSKNPVGAINIRTLLENYLKYRSKK